MMLRVRVMRAGVYLGKARVVLNQKWGVHHFQQVHKALGTRRNNFYFTEGTRGKLHSSVAVGR